MVSQRIGLAAKAVISAFVVLGSTLGVALQDDGTITDYEWLIAFAAFLSALAAVWAIPFGWVGRLGKSLTAGAVAVVALLIQGFETGGWSWSLAAAEWQAMIAAFVVAAFMTWATPNASESSGSVPHDIGDAPIDET